MTAPPRTPGGSLIVRLLRPPTVAQRPDQFRWPADRPDERAARPAPLVVAPQRAFLSTLGGVVGIVAGLAIWLAPPIAGLSDAGKSALAVFVVSAAFWISDFLPIGITGLLAVALLGATRALTPGAAFAAFGNSAVFFILGVFILAAALIQTGLSRRLALSLLSRFERGPFTLASGLMLSTALLTAWMPAQATTAMLFPITLEIVQAMRLSRQDSGYAKVLFLSLAWGAMVGSNLSFLGSTRAPLALGLLADRFQQTISFPQWALASAPTVLLGLVIGLVVLRTFFPREPVDMTAARRTIQVSVAELGPLGLRQLQVAAVIVATIVGWVAFGDRVDLAVTAMLGAATLFAIGALRWQELDGYVHWGIVLMYGGAIALGVAVERTGAGAFLVSRLFDGHAPSPYAALAGIIVLTIVLTEVMSNAAAVAVVLPLAFTLVDQVGVGPVAMVLACSTAAGLDFTFPFSSAPSSIVYASGYLRMRDMLGAGTLMTVAQITLLLVVARVWWPMIGLR